jgi:cytoskeleton protein RodZ
MTDFGAKLRLARERRGVSLRQVAATTKISVAALEALERNDISRLPGGIFSRAFVRSYAVEVGLNPDETVREFVEAFQDGAGPAAPATAAAAEVHGDPDDEEAFQSRQRMARVLLKIIVASFVIAAIILYLTRRQTTALTPSADRPLTIERTATRGAFLEYPWIPDSVRL